MLEITPKALHLLGSSATQPHLQSSCKIVSVEVWENKYFYKSKMSFLYLYTSGMGTATQLWKLWAPLCWQLLAGGLGYCSFFFFFCHLLWRVAFASGFCAWSLCVCPLLLSCFPGPGCGWYTGYLRPREMSGWHMKRWKHSQPRRKRLVTAVCVCRARGVLDQLGLWTFRWEWICPLTSSAKCAN